MPDFNKMKKNGERNRKISNKVVDNFIIYYVASKDRVAEVFDRKVKRYKHIIQEMPKGWEGFLKSEFIAYKIFKSGGLITKYINHVEVGFRSRRELKFLQFQKEHPWKYSFCEILDKPHHNFYRMRNVFTDEEFLVYSQGISKILFQKRSNISIWLLLTSYDGMCHQTYGTIAYFLSFDKDDILFFSRQLNPGIKTKKDVVRQIEKTPLPYRMLWKGAEQPAIANKTNLIRNYAAKHNIDNFNPTALQDRFKVEYANGIARLEPPEWDEFPHYATAYYEEGNHTLVLTAFTSTGFEELVNELNACGFNLPRQPHDKVSMGMLTTASDVLKREIETDPYDDAFKSKMDEEDDANMVAMNNYLDMLTTTINKGENPDIREMAAKAGVDYETAVDITQGIMNKF